MFNKRGQAYLVATLVIIMILSGLTFLSNYEKKDNISLVNDLKKQLEIESEKVLDYGFANNKNIEDLIEEFTEDFSNFAGKEVKIYFITGNSGNMQVYYYDNGKESISNSEVDENISFIIERMSYNCKINSGYNFHFIIIQSIDEEKYIENSEYCKGKMN